MIAIDTSAHMAILQQEVHGVACEQAIGRAGRRLISAATIAECLIVASRRRLTGPMQSLFSIVVTETIDLTQARSERAAATYKRFGKGIRPASLNFGDCFAYATATEFDCPLLYVGDDFARTDLRSTLSTSSPHESL
ncbi:type II toxin-antitoxin system VapC family toxin [Rhizobium glycinendophyticum]|uniref:Ribonuclease VapC n=1 Tax=Rhizobium glycinendophyticum TaxID=2589807 RepID=A0A504U7R9_9HYPH|nr:type II toxin-antitoxin system VapC family toxin [Rhizobium glycinendophyticum]TPP06525.1 type II toxin-antitoxin system VapC family toxin [Rhizobium glycinendophyticum]